MKKLDKWVSQELTANQINSLLEVSFSLTLCNNSMQRQCEFYVTTSDDQFSGWTENNLQSQTCTNKSVMVTVSWFAASLIHYSFLNPSETITSEEYAQKIDEMHRKLQLLQPVLVNRKGPILSVTWLHITQSMLQKVNKLGYNFCLRCNIHVTSVQLTTTSSRILTTFCTENASTISRMQKKLSKTSSNLKA